MLMEGALLLPSFAVSLAYSDGMAVAFLITFAIVLVLGLPLVLLLKPRFEADMIPDEPVAPDLTQRQLAVRIMQACKDWVNDYPNCYKPGIVLQGQTGLGKSFLLNCIEKGLRENGVYTLKLTSYQMLENMRSKHFHLENSDEVFDEMHIIISL